MKWQEKAKKAYTIEQLIELNVELIAEIEHMEYIIKKLNDEKKEWRSIAQSQEE